MIFLLNLSYAIVSIQAISVSVVEQLPHRVELACIYQNETSYEFSMQWTLKGKTGFKLHSAIIREQTHGKAIKTSKQIQRIPLRKIILGLAQNGHRN